MPDNPSDSSVKTALRVIEIFEIFAREKKPLSLTELAGHLAAPLSSSQALIKTLVNLGYLYEIERRKGYYPTGRLLSVAQYIANTDPILERISPGLKALGEATAETIVFGKLNADNKVIYLKVLDSPRPIRYVVEPSEKKEACTDALGKALLSTLSPALRKTIVSLQAADYAGEHLPVGLNDIEQEIERSLERGWFTNPDHARQGVGAFAWPLAIAGNHYAISIMGPRHRLEKKTTEYTQKLRFACNYIEQIM